MRRLLADPKLARMHHDGHCHKEMLVGTNEAGRRVRNKFLVWSRAGGV